MRREPEFEMDEPDDFGLQPILTEQDRLEFLALAQLAKQKLAICRELSLPLDEFLYRPLEWLEALSEYNRQKKSLLAHHRMHRSRSLLARRMKQGHVTPALRLQSRLLSVTPPAQRKEIAPLVKSLSPEATRHLLRVLDAE